jgi:hypothetical protein
VHPAGPLTAAELAELESTLLPALERHHLRLLAHGLRTLQAIAGRRSGPLPSDASIRHWATLQPAIAGDPGFQEAFAAQLIAAGLQLERLATRSGHQPLDLDLADLCAWAVQEANGRLHLEP